MWEYQVQERSKKAMKDSKVHKKAQKTNNLLQEQQENEVHQPRLQYHDEQGSVRRVH